MKNEANATAVKAVWDIIDNRGLLKGVGEDLYDEIKSDLAVAIQVHNHEMQEALDNAIEQITAQLVHGDVQNDGWQRTLDEMMAVQQGAAK